MILFLDNETAGIEFEAGVYRYSELGARILLTAVRWSHGPCDHGPVSVHEWGPEWAKQLQYMIDSSECERVVIHNDEFDCTVMEANGVHVPLAKRYCTMRQARRHGLPGGLDKLCQIYRIPENLAKKKKEGRRLMMIFCRPRKATKKNELCPNNGFVCAPGAFDDQNRCLACDDNHGSWYDWNTKETHPKEWAEFKEYCGHDVLSMTELYYQMPHWNDEVEADLNELDILINARGFQVDTEFAQAAVIALSNVKESLNNDMFDRTGGLVERGTQRDRLLKYLLAEHGVDLPDMQAATLERRLKDENLPEAVRWLIAIRQQSSKVSTSKYATLLRCVNADGRLRGVKVYCGASRTGRFAASKFQSDNMVRPSIPPEGVFRAIRAFKCGLVEILDEEFKDGATGLMRYASEAIRGTVVAAEGHRLLVADLSNIEGRITAWLAGEQWKLDAFAAYDRGEGPDLYKVAYARAFGVQPDEVTGLLRQIGKIMELFLGYGGGVGAFVTGANTYKIELETMAVTAWQAIPRGLQVDAQLKYARAVIEEEPLALALSERVWTACWALSRLWRREHPQIKQLWYDVEESAKLTAIDGRTREVGRLTFDKVDSWLRMRLPSGRYLCYPSPRVKGGTLHFWGIDPYKRIWRYLDTWGGTLVENAAQACARDVLADGLLTVHEEGGRIVLHIHDEIVIEQPENDDWTVDRLVNCMTRAYDWTCGLPLSAKGFETQRYYKDV